MNFLFFLTLQVDIENSVPFKIVPSHTNVHGPAPLPLLETVVEFFLCIASSACVVTRSVSSTLPQWTFFNPFLTVGNARKSYWAISGKYGECNFRVVPFFANHSAATCDVCGGALSWWSTQLLVANSSGLTQAIRARNLFRISR